MHSRTKIAWLGGFVLPLVGGLAAGVVAAAVAVGSLAIVPSASAAQTDQTAPIPAGCDSSRPGVSYGPGGADLQPTDAEPCLTYTFPTFGRTQIIVSEPQTLANGVTTPARIMTGGVWKPRQLLEDYGNLATSIDEGAHWGIVLFPADSTELAGNNGGSVPGFFQDLNSKRLFFYRTGGQEGPVNTVTGELHISYTDDGGETWVNYPGPPLQFFPGNDGPRMFGGPPRTAADAAALSASGYPDVTYLCRSLPSPEMCFKSLDGGINFTEITDASGTDQTAANGAVTAGPDGTLYGLEGGRVTISTDDGTTWTQIPKALPTGFGNPSGCTATSGYGTPPVFLDKDNNIYVGGAFGGQLAATYSKDGGATWSDPVQLQMPGTSVAVCTFAADWNRPGHFVASYMSSLHGYMTVTDDLFGPSPVFTSVQVDSDADPLLPTDGGLCGIPSPAFNPNRPIGVNFSPVDGSPWASYVKDTCRTLLANEQADLEAVSPQFATAYRTVGAVATIARP